MTVGVEEVDRDSGDWLFAGVIQPIVVGVEPDKVADRCRLIPSPGWTSVPSVVLSGWSFMESPQG
jgi:hypothetical protein